MKNTRDYKTIKAANALIKTPRTRQLGYKKLGSIDSDQLSDKNKVYHAYTYGKYFARSYRDSDKKDIELLLSANDFFDDMVHLGYSHCVRVTEKMHFARCHVKVLLAIHHHVPLQRNYFLAKAKTSLNKGLEKYGNQSNFLWLKSKIEAIHP